MPKPKRAPVDPGMYQVRRGHSLFTPGISAPNERLWAVDTHFVDLTDPYVAAMTAGQAYKLARVDAVPKGVRMAPLPASIAHKAQAAARAAAGKKPVSDLERGAQAAGVVPSELPGLKVDPAAPVETEASTEAPAAADAKPATKPAAKSSPPPPPPHGT